MDAESKIAFSKEKLQIKWGIDLFKIFMLFAAKRTAISSSQAHTLQDELEELSQAALGDDTPESIADQLNKYISMINTHMKQTSESNKYAPFPKFSYAVEEGLQSAVMDQIDMVERTLTEAVEAEVIDWDKESDFFAELLQIFTEVKTQKVQPYEGMAKLKDEIGKINKSLPQENQLPLPDLSVYK